MLGVNVVQRSIGFGRGVLFCRWLEPPQLGAWEMALGFLLLAAPLAVLGLPGSFGRYLVRYDQRGQLGLFLRRTGAWTFGLTACVVAALAGNAAGVGRLVYGDPAATGLATLTAACLAAVILHHFLEAVFAGLKLYRVVAAMHFCQSVVFAAAALALIRLWRADAASVVIGYGVGCLTSAVGTLLWCLARRGPAPPSPPESAGAPTHRDFWPPLLQFALGLWIANLLCNLFSIVDRYMILHASGLGHAAAMEQIGNYHTACLVPLLLVSVANLLVGAMTPHLSQDWERGACGRVSARLNDTLQYGGVALLAAGAAVLAFCPWLFRITFDAKYSAGLAVLPWTVAASVWFALLLLAQTYAWCAERTRSAAGPLVFGVLLNAMLNLWWLPVWGLHGAAAATAASTLATLLAQLAVNRGLGMRVRPATLAACVAPVVLLGGVGPALIGAGIAASVGGAALVSRVSPHRVGRAWTAGGGLP